MHRRKVVLAVLLAAASSVSAQGASDPEIFLAPLTVISGEIAVGTPVNITNRRGYDNQPSFSMDSRRILFTSTREDAQADIYRYDIASKKTERLTKSAPESEYSATSFSNGARFSVIRVEKDSSQRLWSFAADGSDPRLVLTDIKPVGYHAWIDADHLALFVLGSPNSLVLADRRTGKGEVLARDIGRTLLPLPGGRGFSFAAHHGQTWMLTEAILDRATRNVRYIRPLVALMPGMDYVAWISDQAIAGSASKLYVWRNSSTWTQLVDLAPAGLTRISRIAVSPDHRWLAIVAEPAPRP